MRLRFFLGLLIAVGGSCFIPARGVVSEDFLPDQAQWITADVGDAPGVAVFQRPFAVETGLVKAVLLAAADQEASVSVNGSPAESVRGFRQAVTFDVTRWVRPGTNLLTVRATNAAGPATCRVMLELAFADGRQHWVISDASWQVIRPGQAPQVAVARGEAGVQRWGNPFSATRSADAYNSWMLAQNTAQATDPATFTVPPGFRVERLRSAQPDEDSWIALAFDPQGRLTVARERRGLLRFTLGTHQVDRVEVIEDTLLECRGLLYAHDSLYVNANNSLGFFRLRDVDGDGVMEERTLLLATKGGVGHGRNQLRLGPDGMIYLVHGDDVVLPEKLAPDSPVQQMANDQLLPVLNPRPPAKVARYLQVGHILQTDRDGSFFRLIAGGLRNPMDVAFNRDGEMFTYEADMERDIGAPWYRPTRVLHLVPGGDYGWRRGHGNLPPYSPDTLPAAVDIGVGSPTGVEFGEASQFPEPYRQALFIGDWAYGRILAVQLRPQGASYTGASTEFLAGRPLNVTDLAFGPDGALYFITGGRGTKSGLYRVTWTGEATSPVAAASDSAAAAARALRRRLEDPQPATAERLNELWANLGHPDRWIRDAARRALERMPLQDWGKRALAETNAVVTVHALLAISRLAGPPIQPALFQRIEHLPWASLDESSQLTALRILSLSLARFGSPTNAAPLQDGLTPFYPADSGNLNRELSRVLAHLRAPEVLAKSLPLLAGATNSEERLHYLMTLWPLSDGWNLERWRIYFTALRHAEQEHGARDYFAALRFLRSSLTNRLGSAERLALGPLFAAPPAVPSAKIAPIAPAGRAWSLDDFDLTATPTSRSTAQGRQVFLSAGCVQCHRFGAEGGVTGPDLTAVAARFGQRDLLDHILNPSKAVDEKYRMAVLTLKDGTTLSGTLDRDEDPLVLQPAEPGAEPVEIARDDVQERHWSDQSPMPSGLLDAFSSDQVVDLLEFLANRGD